MVLPMVFLLLGAILRGYMMNRALGGNDENAMLMYFGYSYPEYIISNYYDANNHIFHTLLVNLMSGWFGEDNALAIRLPTFIFGIACLWMIYLTALELFHSQKIATLALLIAAINPIHIHYSQTARGYSLIMFFSTAVIYYCLKLLRTRKAGKDIVPLALCGFLSVYTLPTNVFFLLGLTVWLGTLFLVPSLMKEYGVFKEERRSLAICFLGAGALIATASFLAYSPVLEELSGLTSTHHLVTSDLKTGSAIHLATSILEKVFPGPLLWFFPFLLAGCFWGSRVHRPRLFLLLIIYFIPLTITWLTGIGGYPRNYLFNLPLLVIFLAAGFVKVEEWITKRTPIHGERNSVAGWIPAFYTVVSLSVVLLEYYPSMQTPDPTAYQQTVRQQAQPNDLLLISDPKNYLYARTILKGNLSRIIQDNKLKGIKVILPQSENIEDYKIHTTKGLFPIFKGLLKSQNLLSINLDAQRKMIPITGAESISALSDDFEADATWKMVSGKGEILKLDNHVFSGKQSLELRASAEQNMVAGALVQQSITISKPSFIVLTWARKKIKREFIPYHPILIARTEFNQTLQVLTGKINDGINIQIKEKPNGSETYHWFINSSIGILPPGRYQFQIILKCDAGQRVLYDGLRLFLIALA